MTSSIDSFDGAGASYPGTRTAPARAYHRKWESSFAAAEDEENAKKPGTVRTTMSERMKRGWKLQSIPGFFFGPLYYLYLRMWRKGLLIIALLPIIALVQTAIGGGKFLNFLIPVLCMTYVKRDYYRFCTRGETIWPWARFSKNIWMDAALIVVVLVACGTGMVALDHDGYQSRAQAHAESDEKLSALSAYDRDVVESKAGEIVGIPHAASWASYASTESQEKFNAYAFAIMRQAIAEKAVHASPENLSNAIETFGDYANKENPYAFRINQLHALSGINSAYAHNICQELNNSVKLVRLCKYARYTLEQR